MFNRRSFKRAPTALVRREGPQNPMRTGGGGGAGGGGGGGPLQIQSGVSGISRLVCFTDAFGMLTWTFPSETPPASSTREKLRFPGVSVCPVATTAPSGWDAVKFLIPAFCLRHQSAGCYLMSGVRGGGGGGGAS